MSKKLDLENRGKADVFEIKLGDSFIENGLPNSGYALTKTIIEFVDNSLEKSVKATRISITVPQPKAGSERSEKESVIITDNGSGMNYQTLINSMSIGVNSGKNLNDLGFYGTGMKSAITALGHFVEIFTKEKKTGEMSALMFSNSRELSTNLKGGLAWNNKTIKDFGKRASMPLSEFEKLVKDGGTVIKISHLDGYWKFGGLGNAVKNLPVEIGTHYQEILKNRSDIEILLNGKKIVAGDVLCDNIEGVERLVTNAPVVSSATKKVYGTFVANYIPSSQAIVDEMKKKGNPFKRTTAYSGMFICRNGRLLELKGYSWGILSDNPNNVAHHQLFNGFRAIFYVNGEMDSIIHSTFSKGLPYDRRDSIDEDFALALNECVKPYAFECRRRERTFIKDTLDANNSLIKKEFEKVVNSIKGIRPPRPKTERKESVMKGEPPVNTKKEKEPAQAKSPRIYYKLEFTPMGSEVNHFTFDTNTLRINTDHPFYTNHYARVPDKFKVSVLMEPFDIMVSALKDGYGVSVERTDYWNNFISLLSENSWKVYSGEGFDDEEMAVEEVA